MPKRRILLSFLCVLLSYAMVAASCAASDEFINLLTAIQPAASGIVGIVCLADPVACPIATAAFDGYKIAAAAATQAYKDWQTAEATEQPGTMGALQAAVATVQTDLQYLWPAAHVKTQTRQDGINAIAQAVAGEISNLLSIIEQTKTAGGTTQALLEQIRLHQDVELIPIHENYGGGADPSPAPDPAPNHHKKAQRKLRVALTAKQFKADLRA